VLKTNEADSASGKCSIMSDLAAREKLRAAIAELTLRLSDLALVGRGDATTVHANLSTSWQKLLPLIEPEVEVPRRLCPHCKGSIVSLATRCLHCWKTSAPVAQA
jgi:hypothetical protein